MISVDFRVCMGNIAPLLHRAEKELGVQGSQLKGKLGYGHSWHLHTCIDCNVYDQASVVTCCLYLSQNQSQLPELDKYIQQAGGADLYVVMKGDANKFNFA